MMVLILIGDYMIGPNQVEVVIPSLHLWFDSDYCLGTNKFKYGVF